MKLFCYYTPSHEILYTNHFLPSVWQHMEFQLIRRFDPDQICQSGEFKQQGWIDVVGAKARCWADAIAGNMGEMIVCSDVDVQFLMPTVKWLRAQMMNGCDIMFQESTSRDKRQGPCCTGFFVTWCNDETLMMWHRIATDLENHQVCDDQHAANRYLQRTKHNLNWSTLPLNQVWLPSYHDDVNDLIPPAEILVHHANFTVGIANKLEQLKHIRGLHFARGSHDTNTMRFFPKIWTPSVDRTTEAVLPPFRQNADVAGERRSPLQRRSIQLLRVPPSL